ncbi:MAG: SMI1/KNR4 family protein [Anaerolineae bacterium]|nr:SMI1/KNR4 family protein [Anaerolineae bacterium]
MDLQAWLDEIAQQIEIRKRSEPDLYQTQVFPPVPSETLDTLIELVGPAFPKQLEAFYRVCGGLDLGSFYNCYFILRPRKLAELQKESEYWPRAIEGSIAGPILPFGFDIAGQLFALRLGASEQALFLPTNLIEDHVYYEDVLKIKAVADDFFGFLDRLLEDVKAYNRNDEDWVYMNDIF